MEFIDKTGRLIHITASLPERAPTGHQSHQSLQSSLSAEEIIKELFDKYVPDSEFISRP